MHAGIPGLYAVSMSPARLDRPPARRRIALLYVSCAACVLWLTAVVRDVQRGRRAERLIVDIRQAGITVQRGMPVWERLRCVFCGGTPNITVVSYRGGPSYNHRWLGERNYLRDIEIAGLNVDAAGYGHELAWIIEQHPIERLQAPSANFADLIAEKLSSKRRLQIVNLRRSDLTDEGLRQLPLERLKHLDIAQTAVTAKGLQELHRCDRLRYLVLDGRQFQRDVVATLNECPLCDTLTLVGPDVTIASVNPVNDLRFVRILRLESTKVRPGSPDLIRALSAGQVHWTW